MDFSFFVQPALKGIVAGIFIGALGYLKNSSAMADANSGMLGKLTSAPVNWSMLGSTIFITTLLSIAAFLLLAMGVPTEALLALVPLAMRESLNDAIALGNNLVKKPASK